MIRMAMAIFLLLLLVGCTSHPPADLKLVDVVADPYHFDVYFDSNVDLLSLHAKNRHQKPVSTFLICSLDKPPNFDTDYDLHNSARGLIDSIGQRNSGSHSIYRFRAHLIFSKTVPGTAESQTTPSSAEVETLLAPHSQVACKVRILVYYGSAYYTNTLYIPTERIQILAAKMSQDADEQ